MSQVVALPPHGIHVHVNNYSRQSSEAPFRFRMPPFLNPVPGIGTYLAQTKQFVSINLFPNIVQGVTDTYQVNVNGSSTIFVLSSNRNYNIIDLVAAINAGLATINVSLQLSYNSDSMQLTLAIPSGVSFQWVSPSSSTTITGASAQITSKYDRLLSMLGFYTQKNTLFTGPLSLTANAPVNLLPTTTIKVVVNQDLQCSGTGNGNCQVLFQIPLDVAFGEVISYEPVQPRTFIINPISLEYLEVNVVDDYDMPLTVPDNIPMNFVFTMIPNTRVYD